MDRISLFLLNQVGRLPTKVLVCIRNLYKQKKTRFINSLLMNRGLFGNIGGTAMPCLRFFLPQISETDHGHVIILGLFSGKTVDGLFHTSDQ